jgi:hypothetical protein
VYIDGIVQEKVNSQRLARRRKTETIRQLENSKSNRKEGLKSLRGAVANLQSDEGFDNKSKRGKKASRYKICSTLQSDGS